MCVSHCSIAMKRDGDKANLIKEAISWGLAYSLKDWVTYPHGEEHEELRASS